MYYSPYWKVIFFERSSKYFYDFYYDLLIEVVSYLAWLEFYRITESFREEFWAVVTGGDLEPVYGSTNSMEMDDYFRSRVISGSAFLLCMSTSPPAGFLSFLN
jgi:hypothetical protein